MRHVGSIFNTNKDMHHRWKDCLSHQYKWIKDVHSMNLLHVVERVISIVNKDNTVFSVYDSSLWAVSMAYLDYRNQTRVLDDDEMAYTKTRGGILGCAVVDGDVVTVSLREILDHYDPGFAGFMGCHSGVCAA